MEIARMGREAVPTLLAGGASGRDRPPGRAIGSAFNGSAFTGAAGQAVLSFDAFSNTSTLSLDVDGDREADFQLVINGRAHGASGFVL